MRRLFTIILAIVAVVATAEYRRLLTMEEAILSRELTPANYSVVWSDNYPNCFLHKSERGWSAINVRTGKEQTDKVKFFLFAMFTIVPAATGTLGIIPMLFYDLHGKKKEQMYAELLARRKEASLAASDGDLESVIELEEKLKKARDLK